MDCLQRLLREVGVVIFCTSLPRSSHISLQHDFASPASAVLVAPVFSNNKHDRIQLGSSDGYIDSSCSPTNNALHLELTPLRPSRDQNINASSRVPFTAKERTCAPSHSARTNGILWLLWSCLNRSRVMTTCWLM